MLKIFYILYVSNQKHTNFKYFYLWFVVQLSFITFLRTIWILKEN